MKRFLCKLIFWMHRDQLKFKKEHTWNNVFPSYTDETSFLFLSTREEDGVSVHNAFSVTFYEYSVLISHSKYLLNTGYQRCYLLTESARELEEQDPSQVAELVGEPRLIF